MFWCWSKLRAGHNWILTAKIFHVFNILCLWPNVSTEDLKVSDLKSHFLSIGTNGFTQEHIWNFVMMKEPKSQARTSGFQRKYKTVNININHTLHFPALSWCFSMKSFCWDWINLCASLSICSTRETERSGNTTGQNHREQGREGRAAVHLHLSTKVIQWISIWKPRGSC